MSSSEALREQVRLLAGLQGIALEEQWIAAIELHLRRLLDARSALDESRLNAQEMAPRFEP